MKTTPVLLLFSLLLVFVTRPAAAQSDYREGYIVQNQGDTLRGLVSYRASVIGDNTCGFKKDNQAAVVTYTPKDIAGYGFPGDKNFRSRLLDHADTLAAEQVFMEELVRGTISLYTYRGTFFAEKQGSGKVHKLYITNQEYTSKSGAQAYRRVNHHIAVLNILMQDCFRMLNKIENVKLTQKRMVELVQEYNQCAGGETQTVFKEAKPWIAVRAGIIGGISHTSLNFSAKDEAYLHLEHAQFDAKTYPTFGIALNVNSPRISEHTSLQVEGSYFKSNYQAQPSYTWFGSQYDNEVAFDLAAVKLGLAVRHDFSGKLFQPFVNAGTTFNFYQTRDYKHTQYVKRTSTSTPEKRVKDNPDFVSKRQQGLMAGAGTYVHILNKKLSVEARYDFGLDLHDHAQVNQINDFLDSDTRTISLLLGFYF